MNGKAAALDRWLEAIRQRELEKALIGQARCDAPEGHDYYVALYRVCDYCGASI